MLRIPTRGRCPNGYASQIFPSFFVSYWKGEAFAYVGRKKKLKDLRCKEAMLPKHGLSTEQFPVSAYIGCSKNLKDLKCICIGGLDVIRKEA